VTRASLLQQSRESGAPTACWRPVLVGLAAALSCSGFSVDATYTQHSAQHHPSCTCPCPASALPARLTAPGLPGLPVPVP
jgi:hypothetical protein